MARRQQNIVEVMYPVLKRCPAWVGPVVAVLVVLAIALVAPAVLAGLLPAKDTFVEVISPFLRLAGLLLGVAVLVAWLAAEIWKWKNRRLLETQTSIESIRQLRCMSSSGW